MQAAPYDLELLEVLIKAIHGNSITDQVTTLYIHNISSETILESGQRGVLLKILKTPSSLALSKEKFEKICNPSKIEIILPLENLW